MERESPHSQTLSRGIRMLEALSEAESPLTIAELAVALQVHRSIAYRILRTLEDHGLVARDPAGRAQLAPRLAALARGVSRDLQAAALPELTAVANDLGMTAFLAVLDRSEVVTLTSVEPRHAHASVAQRPGTRHPLAVGAPGIAIQSALTAAQWRTLGPDAPRRETARPEVAEASERGFATSHDEVIRGLSSVAVPLVLPGQPSSAIAVVYVASGTPVAELAARLTSAARVIAAEL
jgi:DNA-binding IclR family transcriptional regulator